MRFLDAILSIALAWSIHKTDEAVRRTARACAKATQDKGDRQIINAVVNSKSPTQYVRVLLTKLPDYILRTEWPDNPESPVTGSLPLVPTRPAPAITKLKPLAMAFKAR